MSAAARESALAGVALVAGGAMLFAIKGVITKLIYARGMDYESLVVLRSVLALPLFWAWAVHQGAARGILRAPWQAVAMAAFAGALCYSLGSLLDFYALTLIEASLERHLPDREVRSICDKLRRQGFLLWEDRLRGPRATPGAFGW